MEDLDNLREVVKETKQIFNKISEFIKGPWSKDVSLVLFLRNYYDDVAFISTGYEKFKIDEIQKDNLILEQEVVKRIVQSNKDNFEYDIRKPEETLNELTNGTNILDFHVYYEAYTTLMKNMQINNEYSENLMAKYIQCSSDFDDICENMSKSQKKENEIDLVVDEEFGKEFFKFIKNDEKIDNFINSSLKANQEVDEEFFVLGKTFSEDFPYTDKNEGNTDNSEKTTTNDNKENEGR